MIEQNKLLTALFERLQNMSLGIHVALPREGYKPDVDETYLDILWLPNETNEPFVAHNSPTWYQGILQVAIMTPKNASIVDASTIADEVTAFWNKGTTIPVDGKKLTIYRQPWLAPSFKDENFDRLPLSIPYKIVA